MKGRKGKRGFRRKRGKKKGFRSHRNGIVKIGRAHKLLDHFPPALRTTLTVNLPYFIGVAAGGVDGVGSYYAQRGNVITDCGLAAAQATTIPTPFTPYLPNIFPGGINYLLNKNPLLNQDNTQTAPYSRYLVLGSSINVRICNTPDGAGNIVTPAMSIILVPISGNMNGKLAAMTVENYREQPYSKNRLMAPLCGYPITMNHKMSTKKIFGLTRNLSTDDTEFTGDAGTAPVDSKVWNWMLAIQVADLGDTLGYSLSTVITTSFDIIFYERNLLKSINPNVVP